MKDPSASIRWAYFITKPEPAEIGREITMMNSTTGSDAETEVESQFKRISYRYPVKVDRISVIR